MRAEVAFEPLTALAGGILGGAVVAAIAWRTLGRALKQGTDITNPRGARA